MTNNNNKMKVILFSGFKDNVLFYNTVSPPIGLFRLKNYLERRNIDCDVLDLGLTDGNFEDSFEKISNGDYDVIGLSVDSEKMSRYFSMMLDIRSRTKNFEKPSMLVCGGQGATYDYKAWMREGRLDAVLLGFAEKNFYDLCISFSKNREKHVSIYAKDIDGVAFPTNTNYTDFIKNPSKPLTEEEFKQLNYHEIKDLHIPYKDYWDYTYKEGAAHLNLNSNNKKEEDLGMEVNPHCDSPVDTQKFFIETVRLYTSSHCPWKCGFCNSHSFLRMANATMEQEEKIPKKPKNGGQVPMNALATCGSQPHPVYRISPEQIYDIIVRHADKYNPRVFLFNDDAFWDGSEIGFKHIMDLCDLIINGKRKGRIRQDAIFNCCAKVGDFVLKKPTRRLHDQLILKLKEAGFYAFSIGIETFSERLLSVQSINKKGNVSEKDQHMVIEGLLKYGFSPATNIILFIPESTIEDLHHVMKTVTEYMLRGTQIAMTPLLRPLRGSGICELIEKGLTPIKAKYAEWVNPKTKEVFKYPLYCIPQDKQLAEFIEQYNIREYEDMERVSRGEQERIVKRSGWDSKVVPRTITALAVFITLSRFLKKDDWIEYFEKAVYQILARNNYLANTDKGLLAKETLII